MMFEIGKVCCVFFLLRLTADCLPGLSSGNYSLNHATAALRSEAALHGNNRSAFLGRSMLGTLDVLGQRLNVIGVPVEVEWLPV